VREVKDPGRATLQHGVQEEIRGEAKRARYRSSLHGGTQPDDFRLHSRKQKKKNRKGKKKKRLIFKQKSDVGVERLHFSIVLGQRGKGFQRAGAQKRDVRVLPVLKS